MTVYAIRPLTPTEFPPLLAHTPEPPTSLWAAGALPPPTLPLLAVVGSRKYTSYGAHVVEHLLHGLRGYEIGIVSGLAIGIDTLAHEAALEADLYTLAVPGSGLDPSVLYPARNKRLAEKIIEQGGGLLSELPPTTPAARWTFPLRNRIMAGMCHATLLIEAGEKSGTLITARLATDYNRDLLVVPGNIFSEASYGTHQFLKLGATPVTSARDILFAMNITPHENIPKQEPLRLPNLSQAEQFILTLLSEPRDRDYIIRHCNTPQHEVSSTLMKLELQGLIVVKNSIYVRTII
jgi:DNA processing protein